MNIERAAFLLAMKAHKHQRYGDDPYMVHLFDVVGVLHRFGHDEEEMLAVAWLHDIIEDTPMNYNDVKVACGDGVADVVLALTDEIGKNRRERKVKTLPKIKGNLWAQTVKLADWIANVTNAIEEKPKLLQMYHKDFPSFAEALGDEFSELMPMRHCLASLLEEM